MASKDEDARTNCGTGFGVSIFRSGMVNVILFSTFEFVKKRVNRIGLEDPLSTKE